MALMVLILVGVTFGWLSSILGRTEAAGQIFMQIGLGLAVSLAAGLFANSFTMMGGISPAALGAACLAAVLALLGFHAFRRAANSGDGREPAE